MTESNVQPFEFRGNPVATVTAENGTVLFCAKHVATALGYSNTRDAKKTSIAHSDGHVSLNFTTKVTPKGQQYLIQKYLGCTPLDLEAGA